jgi:lipopolysaccharide transport system permease protein
MKKRQKRLAARNTNGDGLLNTLEYRYLIGLFVKRDLFAIYKQTILGPLWFTLQPLLTTLTFTIVFGLFAQIPTGGYPPFIFYFSGIVCWNCFSIIAIKISNSFIENMPVFSKVYFPRLTAPIAATISNFTISLIQYVILLIVAVIYIVSGTAIPITYRIVFTPFLMLLAALMGLGIGLLFAAGTVKYRDLLHLLTFAMTLWMYATPIIYPMEMIPAAYRFLLYLNPVTGVVVNFKYCLFGIGQADLPSLLYSIVFTAVVLLVGVVGFEKVQKNFVDTI